MTAGADATTRDATLAEALDLLPLGACVIVRDLTIHAWNEVLVEWTGITKTQAIGMNLGELYPHLLTGRYYNRLQQVFDGGNPAVYSAALHKHFFPVPWAGGEGEGLMIQQTQIRLLPSCPDTALITVEDVTRHYLQLNDLRLGRARAEAANQAKSAFLANMSHEIRTPMTAILGFADTLRDDDLSIDEKLDAVETIRRNGEHLMTIINDILDLSKIESGKVEIEQMPCSPRHLIDDVCELMKPRADVRRLTLSANFGDSTPAWIRTDPTRLRQILINLVGNAVKFTAQGGVHVEASCSEGLNRPRLLQIDVVDTGVGLTDEQIQRLFRPFTQADSSTTRKFGGTGLGLTISKRLANLLGGDIDVSSEIGHGSTFRLTLHAGEVVEDEVPHTTIGAAPSKPTHQSFGETRTSGAWREGCRILLAEDGLDNQRLLSHILSRAGAQVTVVDNGLLACESALELAAAGHPFQLVLMDMQMPVLDGYSATRRLRAAGYEGPIVALTAHAMSGDRDKCLTAGCDDFVTKPIDRELLLSVVGRFVPHAQDQDAVLSEG